MVKKTLLTIVFVALAAVLVVGAVNRTLARSERTGTEQNRTADGQGNGGGHGKGRAATGENAAELLPPAGNSSERGQGWQGNAVPQEWKSLTGTVTQLEADHLVVTLPNGEEILLEGQPWAYAQRSGFVAAEGEMVTVVGYEEDSEFKAGTLVNETQGQQVQLRDDYGRPGWRGAGRNGS